MQRKDIHWGISVYFDEPERDFAESIEPACKEVFNFAWSQLGIEVSRRVRIYIVKSWWSFILRSFPKVSTAIIYLPLLFLYYSLFIKSNDIKHLVYILIILLTPLIAAFIVKTNWKMCGGWFHFQAFSYSLGIIPPHIKRLSETEIGKCLKLELLSQEEEVRLILCHRMSHAFTEQLSLPYWLDEGTAMLLHEGYLNKRIMRQDTLELIEASLNQKAPRRLLETDSMLLYARGYWRTRFIAETQPEFHRLITTKKHSRGILKEMIFQVYGSDRKAFWSTNQLDRLLLQHFQHPLKSAS